jgi:hypothetical protein
MARTVKSSGGVPSRQGGRKRSVRNRRSPNKEFNPSGAVQIVPARGSDGSETWEYVIARSAMQKLAKAAGVSETELRRLYEPLKWMLYQLYDDKSNWAPTWTKRIKHLQATLSAARRLKVLLQPQWVAAAMRRFEDLELKQQIFGTRGLVDLKTKADYQKSKDWSRTGSQLLEGVMRDVEAVTRMHARLSTMISQFEDGTLPRWRYRAPPPPRASNPAKQYIADCALHWWPHGEKRTDSFKAFADVLYRLAGFKMSAGAIGAQLTSAVRRHRLRTHQRSQPHI